MNNSKIKDYLATKKMVLFKRLRGPIFFTVIISIMLVYDLIEGLYDYYEFSSITLFRIIYTCGFWLIYVFDKEYIKLNDYIKKVECNEQLIFEDKHELIFQNKIKKHGLYIFLLIVALLLFEGFRYLTDLLFITGSVKVSIFIILQVASIVFFILTILSHKQLLDFLISITIS